MSNAVDQIKILCVDDEVNILQSLERLLRMSGYEIHTALSGAEALAFLEQNPVDIVIADQRMPNMTGSEFLRHACKRFPGMVSIMLSGQSDFESLISAVNEGEIFRFVAKPWKDDMLLKVIEEAIGRKRILSFAGKFLRGEQHIATKTGEDVRIQMAQDERGLHIRVFDENPESAEKRMFVILNTILDMLGFQQAEITQILSGKVARQKGKLALSIETGNGILLHIEMP